MIYFSTMFKHIAILVPAVAKSFHASPKKRMNKIKTAYNNVYEIIAPFGMLRFIY
jgi:hypothetical protein